MQSMCSCHYGCVAQVVTMTRESLSRTRCAVAPAPSSTSPMPPRSSLCGPDVSASAETGRQTSCRCLGELQKLSTYSGFCLLCSQSGLPRSGTSKKLENYYDCTIYHQCSFRPRGTYAEISKNTQVVRSLCTNTVHTTKVDEKCSLVLNMNKDIFRP